MKPRVSEHASESMPPKLDAKSETERVHIVAPRSMLARVAEWRAHQRPIPTFSQAIRRLVEIGLDAEGVKPEPETEEV